MASCFPSPSRIDLSPHAQPDGGGGLFEVPTTSDDNEPEFAFLPPDSSIIGLCLSLSSDSRD